ncbi:MAG: family 43 glycosylhydrolase, partial [Mucilaginibacter sp.]
KRKGIYYLLYSDPNCGYCAGTGTSYRTASSPMGPWSAGIKISDNSCGGQPSFVSIIKLKTSAIYLFGSDLWNNGAKNEALANYYWAPLSFASNGAINPINCSKAIRDFSIQKGKLQPENNPVNLAPVNDLDSGVMHQSKFTAQKSGRLVWLSISCFKTSYPEYPLSISLNDADGAVLKSFTIPGDSISWSPKNIILHPDIKVKKNNHYSVTVTTLAMKGRYGFLYYAMPDITPQSEFLYKFRILPGQ